MPKFLRYFLVFAFLGLFPGANAPLLAQPESRQATGIKIGEVTPTSAIVWARLTADRAFREVGPTGKADETPASEVPAAEALAQFRHAAPGAPGCVRVRYVSLNGLRSGEAPRETEWVEVDPERDFTHSFTLTDLEPGTLYWINVESTGPGGQPVHAPIRGRFQTAPPPDAPARVLFTASTCYGYWDADDDRGFRIDQAINNLQPNFHCMIGDIIYYDNDEPVARSEALARYHWQRMFGFPNRIEMLRYVPTYFLKDDHDTLANDCWPGRRIPKMGDLTFEQGQRIFREQVPMGNRTDRTARWGQDLQLWFLEGRDFRSPNNQPDGPEKTILGETQKQWLKQTLLDSDATWKIIVSPTPIVGPDRGSKADNHANETFQHEGDELRAWFQEHFPENLFIICGDRHWQYHSVHPKTGLHEFSCGAASDAHAGGSPGQDPEYHRFHRVQGGFLSVLTERDASNRPTIQFRHHDADGRIVYEHSFHRP